MAVIPGGMPEISNETVAAGAEQLPPEMKAQADAMAKMPGAGLIAAALQNPVIASVASGMSTMAGTPIPPDQIMAGAKVASAHIENVNAEEQEQSHKSGPSMGR